MKKVVKILVYLSFLLLQIFNYIFYRGSKVFTFFHCYRSAYECSFISSCFDTGFIGIQIVSDRFVFATYSNRAFLLIFRLSIFLEAHTSLRFRTADRMVHRLIFSIRAIRKGIKELMKHLPSRFPVDYCNTVNCKIHRLCRNWSIFSVELKRGSND